MVNQVLIIFILLELFTIRHLRIYSKRCIYDSRQFIVNALKSVDSYSSFRSFVHKRALYLDHKSFSFVMSFMSYLKKIIDISQ